MLLGASAAQAQTGGVPGGTEPAERSKHPNGRQLDGLQEGDLVRPGLLGQADRLWHRPTADGDRRRSPQAALRYAGDLQPRRRERSGDRDRPGPDRRSYAWDLTKKTAKRLGFLAVGSGPIQATVTPRLY